MFLQNGPSLCATKRAIQVILFQIYGNLSTSAVLRDMFECEQFFINLIWKAKFRFDVLGIGHNSLGPCHVIESILLKYCEILQPPFHLSRHN